MLCHQKIERALERQQIELQKTLRELRIYKKQHEQWTEVLNKIMEEQVWSLDILIRKISQGPIGLHGQGANANYIPKFQVSTMSLEVA